MSYILNALKKAEQDRLRDDPKELEDFASARWDPYQQQSSTNRLNYILAIGLLLALALGGLAYLGVFSPSSQVVIDNSPVISQAPAEKSYVEEKPVAELEPAVVSMPQLAISGHMYFEQGSSSNRLFANDQSYREGDRLVGGWVLTSIGLEGIEVSSGQRVEFIAYP